MSEEIIEVSQEMEILHLPDCGPCVTTKPFCCTVTVNEEFRPARFARPLLARLVYDVSELACFVEECTTTFICAVTETPAVPVTLYQARVRGCIKFIASVEYEFTGDFRRVCGGVFDPCTCLPNLNHQDRRYHVCCQDCASVNQILRVFPTRAAAEAFCNNFNTSLTCGNVTPLPRPSVSATMCVREEPCGQGLGPQNADACPTTPTPPSCPTSGNIDVTFCGTFTFNLP